MPTVEWDEAAGGVRLIDQTQVPLAEVYLTCRTAGEVARAIREMVVRGAPAIGAAAAFGAALAARDGEWDQGLAELRAARPTARDLFAGLERAESAYRRGGPDAALEEAH